VLVPINFGESGRVPNSIRGHVKRSVVCWATICKEFSRIIGFVEPFENGNGWFDGYGVFGLEVDATPFGVGKTHASRVPY